jgi:subtilase family serine protease
MRINASPARRGAGSWRALGHGGTTALALALAALPTFAAAAPTGAATTTTAHTSAAASASTSADSPAAAMVAPIPASSGHILLKSGKATPVSTTQCETTYALACYSPIQYRKAYDLNSLYEQGITGAGRTIVVVDAFGSPTIQSDLNTFDARWGFPNVQVQVHKWGKVPPFDPKNEDMAGWANETTLDVEYAHSAAPDAKIVLLETAVPETEGVSGFPEFMAGEQSLINAGVGDVISQSFGATENTFPGFSTGDYSRLLALRHTYADAAEHGVSVLAAAGDSGATDGEPTGKDLYPYKAADWPSSDPLVTAVGGTQLYLNNSGTRLQPDMVWNDGYGAGGGGLSAIFARPGYQSAVRSVVGEHRGYPDISMSAAVNGSAWVYSSFDPTQVGWSLVGGTSEATPIFSGIVALADQVAGHRLGNINAALYALGAQSVRKGSGSSTGIVDVTSGDNSFGGVTGYQTGPGFDLATGWGTVDAARFVPALAQY